MERLNVLSEVTQPYYACSYIPLSLSALHFSPKALSFIPVTIFLLHCI